MLRDLHIRSNFKLETNLNYLQRVIFLVCLFLWLLGSITFMEVYCDSYEGTFARLMGPIRIFYLQCGTVLKMFQFVFKISSAKSRRNQLPILRSRANVKLEILISLPSSPTRGEVGRCLFVCTARHPRMYGCNLLAANRWLQLAGFSLLAPRLHDSQTVNASTVRNLGNFASPTCSETYRPVEILKCITY